MKKKVSILIPLYNSEEFISETIESCLQQTYSNIEIIIIDDGSSDKSLEIAEKYAKNYNNIIVESQKNSGASKARNRAFELSTGEYIQYLDADDLLDSEKIAFQMDILTKKDRLIAFGKWGEFKQNIDNTIWKDLPVNRNYSDPKQFLIELWKSGLTVVIHLWLIPRILIQESNGWNEKIGKNDDGEFFARIITSSNGLLFIKDSIGYYRKDNIDSLSKQISTKALESQLNSFETYIKLMNNNLDNIEVRTALALVYSRFIYITNFSNREIINRAKRKIEFLGFKKPIMPLSTYEQLLCYIFGIYGTIQIRQIAKKVLKR
jgi:glycosyltransferase involved in cell wall biosynthesis